MKESSGGKQGEMKHETVAKRHLSKVARAAAKMAAARDELREAILEAHIAGETYRDIAEVAQMTHQNVWKIVRAHADERR